MDDEGPIGLVEAESYTRMKAKCGEVRLMEAVQESFDLILANNPYYGTRLTFGSHLYVFRTTAFPPHVPSFRVLYRYSYADDPYTIELLAIEPVPFDEE